MKELTIHTCSLEGDGTPLIAALRVHLVLQASEGNFLLRTSSKDTHQWRVGVAPEGRYSICQLP